MKKINLRGLSEVLNEKALKNVFGGSDSGKGYCICCRKSDGDGCDFEFDSDTCNNHGETCGQYSTSGFYTCVPIACD